MAQALLDARRVGQEVANVLTEAKARDLHPKVCAGSPLPAEHASRIRDITNAIVPLEVVEQAQEIMPAVPPEA